MNREALAPLAPDLTKQPPRSPRTKLGGYVIAARALDKCRAFLMGRSGEYNYWPCSLFGQLVEFTGIDPEDFKAIVATGADDTEVATWLRATSQVQDPMAIIRWNNRLRDMRLSDMDDHGQEYLEGYIDEYLSDRGPVRVWFDVYDLEEGRL